MLKAEILKSLRNSETDFVSGQALCEGLNVSRTAVWKAVTALKDEGYEIESVTNKGYRLISSPDVLSEAEIVSRLETENIGRQLLTFSETDSTNEELKRRYNELGDGAVAIADSQSRGKGRRGRQWATPPGESIALSIYLKPQITPDKASMLTIVAAMAMLDLCREIPGLDAKIKWPNDLVSSGKKFCGILTEMSAEPDLINYVIVGVGINVNGPVFPEELKDRATSLLLESGEKHSRAGLAAAFLKFFEQRYADFLRSGDLSGMKDDYNSMLAGRGEKVTVMDPKGAFSGISRGINDLGELLVEGEDGQMTAVYAGEVSVRGIYGYV